MTGWHIAAIVGGAYLGYRMLSGSRGGILSTLLGGESNSVFRVDRSTMYSTGAPTPGRPDAAAAAELIRAGTPAAVSFLEAIGGWLSTPSGGGAQFGTVEFGEAQNLSAIAADYDMGLYNMPGM